MNFQLNQLKLTDVNRTVPAKIKDYCDTYQWTAMNEYSPRCYEGIVMLKWDYISFMLVTIRFVEIFANAYNRTL